MNLLVGLIAFFLALVLVLVGITRVGSWVIEQRNLPAGTFATVNDTRMHFVHLKPDNAQLPPVIFLHGASGNLLDQMIPARPHLEGRAELLFLDRPGHGWSRRGSGNDTPFGQAKTIAALMDRLAIEDAIIVGHSLGGAVAAAFALQYPEKTRGLVFISPALYPWPGGDTAWYYTLTARPFIGRLFAETVALPAALSRIKLASACVFAPNPLSPTYLHDAGISLLLRPASFRANAIDVAGLYEHAVATAPRYKDITAPTVVISGDRDTVVLENIHAGGLARDLPNVEPVWVHNLGHKPDWVAPELVAAAVGKIGGEDADLAAIARTVETRIAGDAYGVAEGCYAGRSPQAAPVQ